MKDITVSYKNDLDYDIKIRQDFEDLSASLAALYPESSTKKICIVTDSNVGPIYADMVKAQLKDTFKEVYVFSFTAGEDHKNLVSIQDLYKYLIENHFDRKDILAALGGGVVGDMCGYAAATYLRGIDFIQIPTTLLAQVDSSIGGKTAVDFDCYKNMVGAFHNPRLVYMNMKTLDTLDNRQFASGMAEILKHGLIKNGNYYEWLITNFSEINDKDFSTLEEMIYESCLVKKAVVEKDPQEKGDRALLNFGHTLGHAIEKYMNFSLTHGECVALGTICASFISYKRQLLSMEEYYEIRDMFVPFNLPISTEAFDVDAVIRNTKNDKKSEAGKIKFVLLKKIGKAFVDKTVTDDEMREALKEIIFDEKM